jgi:hypothetical protein
MAEWKPIESAPKDRRILLAYDPGHRINVDIGQYDYSTDLFLGFSLYGCASSHIRNKQPIAWRELPEFEGLRHIK